ncbi:MAG: hypothetical protein Q4F66_10245 [Clostridium sp.]|nr:hypothetical protein [Clostridium sp.]
MKKTLYDYEEVIKKLPLKDKYTKDELLIEDLLIENDKNIEIYYAPHNEHINPEAKVFIVGITPGFFQMSTAISEARKGFEMGRSIGEIQYACKKAGRFSGVIRKNIINMLNDLELNKVLRINDCSDLFDEKDYLLHTVSLIPYSVFIKGSNYSGHTPKLIATDFLMKYVYENFLYEFKMLNHPDEIILIPLGRAVEDVLLKLAHDGLLDENIILKGFPHPSGANVNRIAQFNENKENMIKFLKDKVKVLKF